MQDELKIILDSLIDVLPDAAPLREEDETPIPEKPSLEDIAAEKSFEYATEALKKGDLRTSIEFFNRGQQCVNLAKKLGRPTSISLQ